MVTQDMCVAILAINTVILKHKHLINKMNLFTKTQPVKSEVLVVKDDNWMGRKEEMSFDKQ